MKGKQIHSYITNAGISELNGLQKQALEINEKQQDVILYAPTGSGKTLAFLLPMLLNLKENIEGIQLLILSPTRELALQIDAVFKSLKSNFTSLVMYGGHSFSNERNSLMGKPSVLIGTPGRIVDHIQKQTVDLSQTSYVILDEFDKILEMGFHVEMEKIMNELKGVRKKFLVSATPNFEVPSFMKMLNPYRFGIEKVELASKLKTFEILFDDPSEKMDVLKDLICQECHDMTIIFCNHREAVERVSFFLQDNGILNSLYHGGLDQDERERALVKFRNGSVQYLVTTDLGSRGLDVEDVKHVIHYQLPTTEDVFIHRNGRTARMNKSGHSYIMKSRDQLLPDFFNSNAEILQVKITTEEQVPFPTEWLTLYVGAGKKDKVNKVDIVGFLGQKGKLSKGDIGLIHVLDKTAFVAVKRSKVKSLLKLIQNERIKGKKVKIAVSR